MLRLQSLQALPEVRADLVGAVHEPFLANNIDNGKRCRTTDRRATIGATEAARKRCVHNLCLADNGCQREAARNALGDGHQVRLDARVFAREELACATEARLDLVSDHDDAVFITDCAQACMNSSGAG